MVLTWLKCISEDERRSPPQGEARLQKMQIIIQPNLLGGVRRTEEPGDGEESPDESVLQ